MQTADQARAALNSRIVKTPIRTTIPGWRKQQDKALGLLRGWCQIMGFPEHYAHTLWAYFDEAPEAFAFTAAEIKLAEGGRAISISCQFERDSQLQPYTKLFSIAGLEKGLIEVLSNG